MGWVVSPNAAIKNQADNRLGHLSGRGGFRRFGPSDRIPSTGRRAHSREQGVYDQQPGVELFT